LSLEEADFPKTRGNGNAPEVAVKIDQQTTNANTNSKPASGPFDTDERRLLKPVRPKALPAAGALVGSGLEAETGQSARRDRVPRCRPDRR
jgi:hypothetical protein